MLDLIYYNWFLASSINPHNRLHDVFYFFFSSLKLKSTAESIFLGVFGSIQTVQSYDQIRVNTNEMMKFVNGKRMEESDLCMLLEDLGVVLDRSTWTHFKDVYAQSKIPFANANKGTSLNGTCMKTKILLKENVPPAGPSSSKSLDNVDEADSEGSNNSHGEFHEKVVSLLLQR